MKNSFLFPPTIGETGTSLFILALRLFFGGMLMTHGFEKWQRLTELSTTFPDPFGIGSQYSVLLAIFGELICSLSFIFGFLYRLCMIPMIVTMGFAFFMVHNGSISNGELSFIYFVTFILLYLVGPGKYAVDRMLAGSKGRGRRRR